MKRERFAWITIVPTVWLVACTVTAGLEKVFDPDPAVGFLSHAVQFGQAAATNRILAPATTLDQMRRVIFNDYVDAALAALAVALVIVMIIYAIIEIPKAMHTPKSTVLEIGGGAEAMAGGGDD